MTSKSSDELAIRGSAFHSQWLKIKSQYGKGGEKEDGVEAEFSKLTMKKNMKGKETLSDKVSSANINVWKDHKWIPAAFFENYKKSFQFPEEMEKTYNEYKLLPANINKEVSEYTVDYAVFHSLDAKTKDEIKKYGNAMQTHYLSSGLTKREVDKRTEVDGPNKLPEPKKTHWVVKLFHELTTVFSILLWVGGVLAIIAYGLTPTDPSNLWLAIVLWVIVIVSAVFAYWQNSQSDSIIETFKSFSNAKTTVLREGKEREINATDLVVGDVCIIKIGEKIPADVRIFESNSMSTNNSGLTGESEAVKISTDVGEKGLENPLEAKNLVFFSTLCVSGSGKGVVIRTGKNTFMGKIADLTTSAEASVLNLEAELNKFIYMISVIAIVLGLGFFFGALGVGYNIAVGFAFSIGIIVANVPEGLVSTLTVILALTAKKLFARNMMVKNMRSIETLGTITCICSDKTGTLTQNKMTVVHLWYDLNIRKVRMDQLDIQVDSKVHKLRLFEKSDLSFEILKFASICGSASKFRTEIPDDFLEVTISRNKFIKLNPKATNDEIEAYTNQVKTKLQPVYDIFYRENIDQRCTDGDASESGILKFFETVEDTSMIRSKFPQHRVNNEDIKIPFSSVIKCAGFLRKVTDPSLKKESNYWLAFKGAPDFLIKRCTKYLKDGKEHKLDGLFENNFREANQAFALKGERVLAVAYCRFNTKDYPENFEFKNDISGANEDSKKEKIPNYPTNDLCFVGLIAMEDPPREGVRDAVAKCKKAGVKVIMVTGDQTLTAASIAYQIGIIEDLNDTPEVIMANENLSTLEEAEKKSNTIIIDGIRLGKMMKLEENLSDDNPNKGAFLREWLMKRDVVFARTSPDQKLIIVDGCQKLSHIVAVTGDGVNDAPALKKADIGVAMGKVGTDVAKDAADILLMDDNFSNIIKGIKQGRIIFDCLKKIISYNLSTNFSEFMPIVAFFIWGVPLSLTTIVILTIDVGSNIYPDIAFGYERAESNIMERNPRNVKYDTLCTVKLFSFAYLYQGLTLGLAGFIGYYACLNDYGFKPKGLVGITVAYGVVPNQGDIYNKNDSYKGNSNAFMLENSDYLGIEGINLNNLMALKTQIDTVGETQNDYDLRIMMYTLTEESTWGECVIESVSFSGNGRVCYSLEAIKHSISAYLSNLVFTQIANGLVFRTITASAFEHIMDNRNINMSYFIMNGVTCCVVYIPGLNYAFGIRAIVFEHWFPCLGMFIIMFIFGEVTKYLIRNVKEPDGSVGFFYRFYKY